MEESAGSGTVANSQTQCRVCGAIFEHEEKIDFFSFSVPLGRGATLHFVMDENQVLLHHCSHDPLSAETLQKILQQLKPPQGVIVSRYGEKRRSSQTEGEIQNHNWSRIPEKCMKAEKIRYRKAEHLGRKKRKKKKRQKKTKKSS